MLLQEYAAAKFFWETKVPAFEQVWSSGTAFWQAAPENPELHLHIPVFLSQIPFPEHSKIVLFSLFPDGLLAAAS